MISLVSSWRFDEPNLAFQAAGTLSQVSCSRAYPIATFLTHVLESSSRVTRSLRYTPENLQVDLLDLASLSIARCNIPTVNFRASICTFLYLVDMLGQFEFVTINFRKRLSATSPQFKLFKLQCFPFLAIASPLIGS